MSALHPCELHIYPDPDGVTATIVAVYSIRRTPPPASITPTKAQTNAPARSPGLDQDMR